jgi:GNAT superfamily N-acetyltransferase
MANNNYVIISANSDEEIQACFPAMRELRPHLQEPVFLEQIKRQQQQGYVLVYIKSQEQIKSVAGYRFAEFLAWGKILYIDDLITPASARGNGYGAKLLSWLIEQAKVNKCDQVHLDTGYSRHDAHRLYLKHGLRFSSHHVALAF